MNEEARRIIEAAAKENVVHVKEHAGNVLAMKASAALAQKKEEIAHRTFKSTKE